MVRALRACAPSAPSSLHAKKRCAPAVPPLRQAHPTFPPFLKIVISRNSADAPVLHFFIYEKNKYAGHRKPKTVNKTPKYTYTEDPRYCQLNQNVRNLYKVLLLLTLYCTVHVIILQLRTMHARIIY